MSQMDLFLPLLSTSDTKKKLCIGTDIVNYLEVQSNSIECEDIGSFIDGMVPWLHQSNFKVAQNGLEILGFLVDRMKEEFRPYINSVLSSTVDRLGDSREVVREKAQVLLMKLMEHTVSPQYIFEKLSSAFSHKNGKVREEILIVLKSTVTYHGSSSLHLSRLLPSIVKLLSDPAAPVRDAANHTLVEIYRHVGERVRHDLQKKYDVPSGKLPLLMAKFDEVRQSGQMMPTASLTLGSGLGEGDDETDRAITKSSKSRASSAPPTRRTVFTTLKPPATSKVPARVTRTASTRRGNASTTGPAGAVDEASFIQAFEDVAKVQIFSPKDLEEHLISIRDTISDTSKDWDRRVDSLKKMRSILVAGGTCFDELYPHLRLMEQAFIHSVKDLRSQVVREACITIAYMSQQLGHRLDHFAESLLQPLINLIPNSAKVMSTAGMVAVRFIIQYTHHPRLIPILTSNLSSKSKEIRRVSCEFLDQLMHTWPTHSLEKYVAALQEAIRKGISDADPDARAFGRKAYWGFADHFKDQSESLLNSLENTHRRMLHGEHSMPNSSSSNSISNSGYRHGSSRSQSSSVAGSTENLSQYSSLRHTGIPTLSGARGDTSDGVSNGSPRNAPAVRSNSAIDLQAAQRAKVRAQYAAANRMKAGSGTTLPPPRKISEGPSNSLTPERKGRSRSRVGGVTQSQPGSRSGSPSSRLSYATYAPGDSSTVGRSPRRSGIPRSTGTSRETSPNRFGKRRERTYSGKLRSRSITGSSPVDIPPKPSKPVMAQRILQQSREAESALADALHSTTRKRYGLEDHSDESETSSVCSERSYDSMRRMADPYSWYGSQQRVYRDMWDPMGKQDVSDVIASCASTHWGDRKEGLLGLQSVLRSNRMLTATELKRVTEIFTKLFMDAHTKVFGLFLDTLNELIIQHKADLGDWLYVLMTRLFNKLGSDLLGSVQAKIHKTLELIRIALWR